MKAMFNLTQGTPVYAFSYDVAGRVSQGKARTDPMRVSLLRSEIKAAWPSEVPEKETPPGITHVRQAGQRRGGLASKRITNPRIPGKVFFPSTYFQMPSGCALRIPDQTDQSFRRQSIT